MGVDVELISLRSRFILLRNGVVLPISDFFDRYGDPCDPDDAASCVAGTDEFGWVSVSILEPGDGEGITVH
jgi:hypothetical protein